jgi:hypothetical protein
MFLKKYVQCSLEKDCMAPVGSQIICNFPNGERYLKYANCHRFDQSAINIIASIATNNNDRDYTFIKTPVDTSRD